MNGVLLMNLGTPDAPTPDAIRRYLRQFLSDRRVVDLPRALWLPVLYGFILPLRPRKLVPQYAGVTRVVALPLYPQFSATTTASSFDALHVALAAMDWNVEVREIEDYHADARYIAELAVSVREHWAAHGRSQRLLMSFHGLPQRYVDAGDPYERQCAATARNLAAALGLQENEWQLAYQSRVGRAQWLQPYTDVLMDELPRAGVRTLDVVCPGFSADCLETLDEIAVRYAARFVEAGGERLRYVPALNARPGHVAALAAMIGAQPA